MLYHYPHGKHRRTASPPSFATYQRYKPSLREEFRGICVYCRKPDIFSGPDDFGVDHYLPQKHRPDLTCAYSNLFYCCNECNRLKGAFVPFESGSDALFVPNPCDHSMFRHLQAVGFAVRANSAAGDWTVKLLRLNSERRQKLRQVHIRLRDGLKETASRIRKSIEALKERQAGLTSGPELDELVQDIITLESDLTETDKLLADIDN